MQGSVSVVKTVKTKMRNYDERSNSYDRSDRKRDKERFKKFRKNGRADKRNYSFDD